MGILERWPFASGEPNPHLLQLAAVVDLSKSDWFTAYDDVLHLYETGLVTTGKRDDLGDFNRKYHSG